MNSGAGGKPLSALAEAGVRRGCGALTYNIYSGVVAHTHAHIHALTHARTHARTHTHKCTHKRTNTHTHTHTHTQVAKGDCGAARARDQLRRQILPPPAVQYPSRYLSHSSRPCFRARHPSRPCVRLKYSSRLCVRLKYSSRLCVRVKYSSRPCVRVKYPSRPCVRAKLRVDPSALRAWAMWSEQRLGNYFVKQTKTSSICIASWYFNFFSCAPA